jgi:uncharacterized Zn finger protein
MNKLFRLFCKRCKRTTTHQLIKMPYNKKYQARCLICGCFKQREYTQENLTA